MTSLSSDPQAAAHVQSCLKDLYKLVRNVEDARKTSEPTLTSITATHKKIESEQKITPTNKARLKNLYDDAIKDSSKVNIFLSSLYFLISFDTPLDPLQKYTHPIFICRKKTT